MNNTQHKFFISLKKKKPDLKNLRQEKLRGCYIRSKMQWTDEGEKPSFFFINLETNILQIKLFLNLLMNLEM